MRFLQALRILLVAAAVATVPARAVPSPGLIAYSSNDSPLLADHLFTSAGAGPNGSLRMLGEGYGPVWSPDGRHVAFRRGLGAAQVFVMNGDGTGIQQVTHSTETTDDTISPQAAIGWSPDGTKLSYMVLGPITKVLDLHTGATVTFPTAHVDWSPDGRHLVYLNGAQGQAGTTLVIASPDGSVQKTLSVGGSVQYAWSPDSKNVAFTSAVEGDGERLEVVGVGGSPAVNVASDRDGFNCLSWYPGSSRIEMLARSTHALLSVLSTGGGLTRLTTISSNWPCPAISPDGQAVAVVSARSLTASRGALDLVASSGGQARTIAQVRLDIRDSPPPTWSPDGRAIALPVRGGRILVTPVSGGPATTLGLGASRFLFSGLPAWRPGGSTFLVSAHIEVGYQKIWVTGPDGPPTRELTSGRYDDEYPSWSPDGSTLAFVRAGPVETAGIWVVDASGRSPLRLLAGRGYSTPEWSPDGHSIAYVLADGVWVMNADGTHPHRVVRAAVLPGEISWSPDGASIAYAAGAPDSSIFVIGADGRGGRQVTSGGDDWNPAWSPDGSVILFAGNRGGNPAVFRDQSGYGLFTVRPDGTNLQKLLTQRASHPSWSPDGKRFAFQSLGHVYTADADGTNVVQLDSSRALTEQPSWS